MKLFRGIVLNFDEMLSCQPDETYDDIACGDYIVHGLFRQHEDGTVETLIREDNCHAAVEDIIDSFLEGLYYAGAEYTLTERVVWYAKDGASCYDAKFEDLTVLIKGETNVH